jgi:hypothetical protein
VSATHQVSAKAVGITRDLSTIYDQFWVRFGGTAYHDKVYKISTRSQRGVDDPVPGTHKLRKRQKRQRKVVLGRELATCASRAFDTSGVSHSATFASCAIGRASTVRAIRPALPTKPG